MFKTAKTIVSPSAAGFRNSRVFLLQSRLLLPSFHNVLVFKFVSFPYDNYSA